MWICQCDCGTQVEVIGSHLRSGHTLSCGCNRTTIMANGHYHERLYRIWYGMINRCTNPERSNFKWYGGRGISVCKAWQKYEGFRNWALKNGYSDMGTIDRINPDENYCPENCQWVDMKTQANNRRSNRIIQYKNNSYTATQFAEKVGLSKSTVFNRLNLGWSPSRIASTPERNSAKHGHARKIQHS